MSSAANKIASDRTKDILLGIFIRTLQDGKIFSVPEMSHVRLNKVGYSARLTYMDRSGYMKVAKAQIKNKKVTIKEIEVK
jgi:hypothetical protein